jgi:hypothetical protein
MHHRLLIGSIYAIAVFLRTEHLFRIDIQLPYRLGGLFVHFSDQIRANHFVMPATIPYYTEQGIPFGYPPLVFYLHAVLVEVFGFDRIALINILPAAGAILSFITFHWLLRSLRLSFAVYIVALAVYGLVPVFFVELLEAGGIVESFGLGILNIMLLCFWQVYKTGTLLQWIVFGLSLGLGVLTSPGTMYVAILMGVIATIISFRKSFIRTLGYAGLSATVASLVAASYLVPVLSYHGISIYTQTFGGQQSQDYLQTLLDRIGSYITQMSDLTLVLPVIWDVLVIVGLVYLVTKRAYLPIVILLVLVTTPSEYTWLPHSMVALIIGVALAKVFWPAFQRLAFVTRYERFAIGMIVLLFLVLHVIAQNTAIKQAQLSEDSIAVSHEELEGMAWARENLDDEIPFIVLMSNGPVEWSPVQLQHDVLNNRFGTEWDPDKARVEGLREDIRNCSDADCLFVALKNHSFSYVEIYLMMDPANDDSVGYEMDSPMTDVTLVYESDAIVILHLKLL